MDFKIHPGAKASIDTLAEDARQAIQPLDVGRKADGAVSIWGPKPQVTITEENMIGDPIAWIGLADGQRAWAFAWIDDVCFGIPAADYCNVETLIDALLKIRWVRSSVSDQYILTIFVKWARAAMHCGASNSFANVFLDAAQRDISEQTVWAPVQYLRIEAAFPFGAVQFVLLDEPFFDRLALVGKDALPEKTRGLSNLIEQMKRQMLGLAAVKLQVIAEPIYAQTAALQMAEDAIGLLRFFSVATFNARHMATVSLLDALIIPKTHIIVGDSDVAFSYSHSIAASNADFWEISRTDLAELSKGEWSRVVALLDNDQLNQFEETVRSSILSFSRAVTFPDIADRLIFAMSAIEGLLLRDQNEQIQQNVGERMAFLTANGPEERRAIVANLREAYRMRSQYIHHRLSTIDAAVLDQAFWNIRLALSQAVVHLSHFRTKADFIEAIEKRKYGG